MKVRISTKTVSTHTPSTTFYSDRRSYRFIFNLQYPIFLSLRVYCVLIQESIISQVTKKERHTMILEYLSICLSLCICCCVSVTVAVVVSMSLYLYPSPSLPPPPRTYPPSPRPLSSPHTPSLPLFPLVFVKSYVQFPRFGVSASNLNGSSLTNGYNLFTVKSLVRIHDGGASYLCAEMAQSHRAADMRTLLCVLCPSPLNLFHPLSCLLFLTLCSPFFVLRPSPLPHLPRSFQVQMALESDARNMPVPKNSSAELQTIVNMASLERDVKKHGAAIMMELHWDCDLDHDVSEGCKPEVKVRRLDSASPLSRGFNFRYVLRGKLRGEVERGG